MPDLAPNDPRNRHQGGVGGDQVSHGFGQQPASRLYPPILEVVDQEPGSTLVNKGRPDLKTAVQQAIGSGAKA